MVLSGPGIVGTGGWGFRSSNNGVQRTAINSGLGSTVIFLAVSNTVLVLTTDETNSSAHVFVTMEWRCLEF